MNRFKKTICLLLACVMLLGFVPAVSAQELTRSGAQIPIVIVGGDGEKLIDENGNEVFRFIDFANRDTDTESIKEAVLNVVKPLLVQGMLTGNFEPYYEALYKEVAELFEPVLLDKDGNPRNGTDIEQSHKDSMAEALRHDYKQERGWYDLFDYHFYYDWRLDPCETAEKLHNFIEGVKAVTHSEKVAIVTRCVGSAVVMAYIAEHGTDSVYSLGMDGITANGAEPLSESISGKFAVNGAAINRMLYDMNALGFLNVDSFITETIDLLVKSGTLDMTKNALKIALYYRIVEGATSALARSTFFSCPMYWSCVAPEDYNDAMNYVFGPEGSEKRAEYAGLIAKIENYHNKVGVRVKRLLQQVKDAGGNVGIIAKYGYQMSPVCESADVVADQIISVKRASFGATTSLIYNTLDDKYIAARVEAGGDKYISPDKQVDASTCMFPDSTWFVKGLRHSEWSGTENAILYTVTTADRQLTVDDFDISQFIVGNYQTHECEKMTTQNCNTYHWDAANEPAAAKTPLQKIRAWFEALKKWWTSLLHILKERRAEQNG